MRGWTTPCRGGVVQAWRDAVRAAELAERLAARATDAAG